MPIYRDKARGCFVFEFDRAIQGRRVRARKHLPKVWTRAQADAYDRQESARLYAVATGVQRPEFLIEDAVAVYIKERVPSLKSGKNIVGELAQMFPFYQGRPMSDLAQVCREFSAQAAGARGNTLSPATMRNRIRYLTSACRYGWKHHGMSDRDPAERVLSPTVKNARHFYPDRRTMLTIAKACTSRGARAAIRISFYSGLRMSEIIASERRAGMFILADSKNDDPRIVPIHPKIASAVKVKLGNPTTMSKAFKTAARAVGVGHLRFHDLRHGAASEMINAGVQLYTVGAALGHRSAQSTARYAHLATNTIGQAIALIGRK